MPDAPRPARTPPRRAARTPAPADPKFPGPEEPGPEDLGGPTGPRLDARRAHVLDRAAAYVALADHGLSAAQIARRRRKSPGHVSILLRLGRALADVPADERAALRHPRVTWRLVQRLVRADVDPGSLRRQLRAAVGGFSTHTVDRRQQRTRRTPAAITPGVAGAAPGVAWGWDAAWFARDPDGYAAAHRAHLTHLHRVVAGRAADAVRARRAAALAGRADAGQSLRGLQRSLARRLAQLAPDGTGPDAAAGTGATPAEQRALATFAALGTALAGVPAAGVPAAAAPTPEARAAAASAAR
ncbi:hypothetical protein tb265_46830 [Gemmatimonadetes bacterium T265]|nr:hypothetical protein tb265_46830 [Gemmatimonadetes bacterium T265]